MTRKTCFLLALAPLALLISCDQKPQGKPADPANAQKTKKKSLGSPDLRFAEERSEMINGKFAEAAEALGETATIPKIREPLYSWIQFHQGLALLLAGKGPEARAVFGALEDRGPTAKGGTDTEAVTFLIKLAHLLRGTDPVPGDVSKDYDKWSFQGIAFLALALKDWNLDKLDDATALFRQFNDAAPDKLVEWADGPEDLRKLKEIGNNFVNDYTEYTPARQALDAADGKSMDDQREAVEIARKARANMKLTTKLSKSLDDTLAVMGPKVAAVMEERSKANAEETAADEKALSDAKQKRTDFLGKFAFEQARSVIADAALKTEKARDEQALLTKKASWLANFKSQLIEDLNKKGYKLPIKSRSGAVLPGAVTKADEQQVMVGATAVPWADIALDSDFAMGSSFIQPDMPPEIAGFRKWHLGVFGIFAGKTKEALDLLHQAAELRPIFKDELPLFEKFTPPY